MGMLADLFICASISRRERFPSRYIGAVFVRLCDWFAVLFASIVVVTTQVPRFHSDVFDRLNDWYVTKDLALERNHHLAHQFKG